MQNQNNCSNTCHHSLLRHAQSAIQPIRNRLMEQQEAVQLLRTATNNINAEFREGQWDAIDTVANKRQKLLVVERTGWGKSMVYFIGTRILRDRGAGSTLIVSPLLSLMRNQMDAAKRLEIRATTINSTNQSDWENIESRIAANHFDVLFISPERLANERFVDRTLMPIADRIGMFVVDEAHCISDWGHDFRPDYQRIVGVLQHMPANMPVLCTTATANNRVVDDIRSQFSDIGIQRGTLVRKSLVLQTIKLPTQTARLAWLAQHIEELPGTGIVYVLTKRDADQVSSWLNKCGIQASAYYSDVKHYDFQDENDYRQHLEELLQTNQIKVLVATVALGMGYDKPDLGFVIHYQSPGSVVSYYQQVGRAGRSIDKAYGIMLSGTEDEDIHEYFRRTAFPDEKVVDSILKLLESSDGLSLRQIESKLNVRWGKIEKVVKLLSVENPSPIIKEQSKWKRTAVVYQMDHEKIRRLSHQRELEWKEIQDYVKCKTCLMEFLSNSLDDPGAIACGRCSGCLGKPIVGIDFDRDLAIQADRFLKRSEFPLKSNIQVAAGAFPQYGFCGNLPKELRAEQGRVLSHWGRAGWGELVAEDKHVGKFRDELVEAIAEMVESRWQPIPTPAWLTCVPSKNHPDLVSAFARKLAYRLGIRFIDSIDKMRANEPQKIQENRFHQCNNLDGVFRVKQNISEAPVFLVDDIVDSGWTMTVLAALLRQNGSGLVYPIALASASVGS